MEPTLYTKRPASSDELPLFAGARTSDPQTAHDAAHVITADDSDCTDADHAALLALPDDPWEPVETLEGVVNAWCDKVMVLTPSLRADLCTRLRTWLEQQPAPELTAAQHIKALRKIGAQWYPRVTSLRTPYEGAVISWWPLTGGALVLPEELAPTAEDVFGKDWDK